MSRRFLLKDDFIYFSTGSRYSSARSSSFRGPKGQKGGAVKRTVSPFEKSSKKLSKMNQSPNQSISSEPVSTTIEFLVFSAIWFYMKLHSGILEFRKVLSFSPAANSLYLTSSLKKGKYFFKLP